MQIKLDKRAIGSKRPATKCDHLPTAEEMVSAAFLVEQMGFKVGEYVERDHLLSKLAGKGSYCFTAVLELKREKATIDALERIRIPFAELVDRTWTMRTYSPPRKVEVDYSGMMMGSKTMLVDHIKMHASMSLFHMCEVIGSGVENVEEWKNRQE